MRNANPILGSVACGISRWKMTGGAARGVSRGIAGSVRRVPVLVRIFLCVLLSHFAPWSGRAVAATLTWTGRGGQQCGHRRKLEPGAGAGER